jgi:hypothetical protein
MAHPYPGLQIDKDWEFHRRAWRWERVGWAVMLVLLALSLLGLTDESGPLSTTNARSGELIVTYPRFLHIVDPFELEVVLPMSGGESGLFVSEEYLSRVEIERVTPRPHELRPVERGVIFSFRGDPGVSTLTVRIRAITEHMALVSGTFGVAGRPAEQVEVTHWSYG